MDRSTIGFIGAGNMATAICRGLLSSVNASDIYVFDIDSNKTDVWKDLGCCICNSAKETASLSDYLIIAVKPQNISELLSDISDSLRNGGVLVSIAAGVSIDKIKGLIGDYPVVRVMPNACMTVLEGASAVSASGDVTAVQLDKVCEILRSCGAAEIIDESLQNSIIAVHGSSPAFIFLFVKAIIDEAEAEGISYESAKNLICSTLIGSAKMMIDSTRSLDELISVITSKGGTTEAALKVLDNNNFYDSIRECMKACRDRAEELGRM